MVDGSQAGKKVCKSNPRQNSPGHVFAIAHPELQPLARPAASVPQILGAVSL